MQHVDIKLKWSQLSLNGSRKKKTKFKQLQAPVDDTCELRGPESKSIVQQTSPCGLAGPLVGFAKLISPWQVGQGEGDEIAGAPSRPDV